MGSAKYRLVTTETEVNIPNQRSYTMVQCLIFLNDLLLFCAVVIHTKPYDCTAFHFGIKRYPV